MALPANPLRRMAFTPWLKFVKRGQSGEAPEIDGQVQLLPPEKASRTLKVGEFTRARIVGTKGHDLVGLPL